MSSAEPQTTSRVIMIRPASFTSNPETAASNSFQAGLGDQDPQAVREQARREFDNLVEALRAAEVEVAVFEDEPEPCTPDALFPNNWLTTHADGTVVMYPMQAPSRQRERRPDILDRLEAEAYHIEHRIDLGPEELRERYLEGTGSLVLDRENRVAYACLSPRTDSGLLGEWCERFGYEAHLFRAAMHGQEIYHTNVMMWLGSKLAGVCLDAVPDPEEREALREALASQGRQIVEISADQMASFAGNMLELRSSTGRPVLALSEQALSCLDEAQLGVLREQAVLAAADIATIEKYAGGSVRCMLAENFLPRTD